MLNERSAERAHDLPAPPERRQIQEVLVGRESERERGRIDEPVHTLVEVFPPKDDGPGDEELAPLLDRSDDEHADEKRLLWLAAGIERNVEEVERPVREERKHRADHAENEREEQAQTRLRSMPVLEIPVLEPEE